MIKNTLIKALLLLSFLVFFTSCTSQHIKLIKNPDFKIIESFKQNYVGGLPGNAGFNVFLIVNDPTGIVPDSLYFQNRVAKVDIRDQQWVAHYRTVKRNEINFSNNQNAKIEEKISEMPNFPFKIEEDEAILLYHQNQKSFYYKIKGIKTKESVFYP